MNVFIAYDFLFSATLPDVIDAVAEQPPDGFQIFWPGAPDGRTQGAIWNDVVRPGIHACHGLVAYADSPNINVAFEIGYALGVGKPVALTRVRRELPDWLTRPPLVGLLCEPANTPDQLRQLILRALEHGNQLAQLPQAGNEVLYLCPPRNGAVYLELAPPGWRTLPVEGWGLHQLPELLKGIGRVVWVIVPHDESAKSRDGDDNSALAVIAGCADSSLGMQLQVFKHAQARSVADLNARTVSFSNRRELRDHLAAIESARRSAPAFAEQSETKLELAATEELRLAFETTPSAQRPCRGVVPDDLDWDLLEVYGKEQWEQLRLVPDQFAILKALGLLSPVSPPDCPQLSVAAALCFCRQPEKFIPQSRANFIAGELNAPEIVREVVTGPLPHQIKRLTTLVMNQLERVTDFSQAASRKDITELPAEIVREVISNAVSHRDYTSSALVQVHVKSDYVEVRNPGSFPPKTSWNYFMKGDARSHPSDPTISMMLSKLGVFEGMGRGFSMFREFARERGAKNIKGIEEKNPDTVLVQLKRSKRTTESRTPTTASRSWSVLDWFRGRPRRLSLCPSCLVRIDLKGITSCPNCGKQFTRRYIQAASEWPTVAGNLMGFANTGKSMYLASAMHLLRNSNAFIISPLTELSLQHLNDLFRTGPAPTSLSQSDTIAFEVTLAQTKVSTVFLLRDSAGERYDGIEFSASDLNALRYATPIVMCTLKQLLDDTYRHSQLQQLLENLDLASRNMSGDISKPIVVLTKADEVADLPSEIAEYLYRSEESIDIINSLGVPRYLEGMRAMNHSITEWLSKMPSARNSIKYADMRGMELRFSVTGFSTKSSDIRSLSIDLMQLNRCVDPLMWLLYDRD